MGSKVQIFAEANTIKIDGVMVMLSLGQFVDRAWISVEKVPKEDAYVVTFGRGCSKATISPSDALRLKNELGVCEV